MTAKCIRCPVAPGSDCLGTTSHRFFCGWAREGNPLKLRHIQARSGVPVPAATADETVPIAEANARLEKVRTCPHRGEKAGCGCQGLRTCALGRGQGGKVSLAECLACVESHPELSAPVEASAEAPSPTPEPPGLASKVLTFAKAVATHVAAGMPTLDDEAYYARLAICETCPLRIADWTCAACGCDLKVKARWAKEACPEGKWPTA